MKMEREEDIIQCAIFTTGNEDNDNVIPTVAGFRALDLTIRPGVKKLKSRLIKIMRYAKIPPHWDSFVASRLLLFYAV